MRGTLEQMPVETRLVVPLPPLAKLSAHKEKFFAGLGIHIAQQESEVGVLLPIVPWHFAEECPLAIDNFIVRQGQDKIFVEGVEEAKSERIMVELTIERILAHVVQHIMHPAHIPFQSEPETTDRRRPRHQRPGSRFLSDGVYVRIALIDGLIEAV